MPCVLFGWLSHCRKGELPTCWEDSCCGREPPEEANYRAACRARSRADFISKMGIVEEEADEVAYWMALLVEGSVAALKN